MTDFLTFWSIYPRRKGGNPRFRAEQKWHWAIKSGGDPYHIISSARKYGDELRTMGKIDTEFVCMAATWLNQKRWLDYALDIEGEKRRMENIDADMLRRGWEWKDAKWQKIAGRIIGRD
jgi:hypothetical protein